jgi:hypothetical protein
VPPVLAVVPMGVPPPAVMTVEATPPALTGLLVAPPVPKVAPPVLGGPVTFVFPFREPSPQPLDAIASASTIR